MPKVIGIKVQEGVSRKTGNEYRAVIVHYVDEFPPKSDGIGNTADNQFVDRETFDLALEGRSMEEVIGKDCTFFYTKGGYLSEMVIGD